LKILLLCLKNKFKETKDDDVCADIDPEDKAALLRETLDKQNMLIDWKMDLIDSTFYNYRNLVISFGFVTLFAIVFPLTPIIYWVVTLADILTTKSLLINISKRPNPVGAQDIGEWHNCLRFIAVVGIFTNVAIFVYTSNNLYFLDRFLKIVTFFASSFLLMFIMLLIESCTRDSSLKVDELIQRQTYLVEKMNRYIANRDEEINDYSKIVDKVRFRKSITIRV